MIPLGINIYGYHLYRAITAEKVNEGGGKEGFVVKLCCVFPPGTLTQIVDGHKVHMAIEIWELLRLLLLLRQHRR